MLKAIGQTLFSSGLQNPKFTAQENKVSVLNKIKNKNSSRVLCHFARNLADFGYVNIYSWFSSPSKDNACLLFLM